MTTGQGEGHSFGCSGLWWRGGRGEQHMPRFTSLHGQLHTGKTTKTVSFIWVKFHLHVYVHPNFR